MGMVGSIHIRSDKLGVRNIEGDGFFFLRIPAQEFAGFRVTFFEKADTLGWVYIQRDMEPVLLKPVQQTPVIGKQLGVPGIAGPAGGNMVEKQLFLAAGGSRFGILSEALQNIGPMPVHINGCNGYRELPANEFFHQGLIFRLGIGAVAAPPVAQRVLGDQGYLACQTEEIPEATQIVMTIGKEIQIPAAFPGQNSSVLFQQKTVAVVHHADTGAGHNALFQFGCAADTVQGSGRTQQIAGFKIPDFCAICQGNTDHLPFLRIDTESCGIGFNCPETLTSADPEGKAVQIPVPYRLGRHIRITPSLQSDQTGC